MTQVSPSPSSYPTHIHLPVTRPILNGDEKLNPIPVPNEFGYPVHISIPAMDNIFNFFFNPRRDVVMHYPANREWRLMAMVIEKREVEIVRYGRKRERTLANECICDTETLTM